MSIARSFSLVLFIASIQTAGAAVLASRGDYSATTEDFEALHFMSSPVKVSALRAKPSEIENSVNEILAPRMFNSVARELPKPSAEEQRYAALQIERAPLGAALNIAERRARASFKVDDELTQQRAKEIWVTDQTAYFADESADFSQIFFDIARRGFAEVSARIASAKADLAAGKPFDEVLQKYSDDANVREVNGFIRGMTAGRIDALIGRVLFRKLGAGEISDVVPSRAGLHIIRLDRKAPRAKKPFEEVKAQILEKILETDAKAARAGILDKLKPELTKFDDVAMSAFIIKGPAENTDAVRTIHQELGIPVSEQPPKVLPQ